MLAGSIFLYFGAEGLVRGSSSVALRRGITPLVVGLTIVAFGTSSPELVVSVTAAFKDNAAIAIGNVIGSNICNIALILGLAALIRPIKINLKVVKTDIIIMIGITIVLVIMIITGSQLSRIEGGILFAGIIIYTSFTLYLAKKEKIAVEDSELKVNKKKWMDIVFIVGGFLILVLGANLFISGAIVVARSLGVSEIIIGLSIVALGTSLPELATSVVAAIRGEGDISIGNIVGSNIFNILCILGVATLLHPIVLTGDNSMNIIDLAVMVIVSIILLPLAWSKLEISRLEGAFLLLIYFGYMFYIYTYRANEVIATTP
jgi:cation:H+ antiporter